MQTAQPAMKMSLGFSENKSLLLRNSCSPWSGAWRFQYFSTNDCLIVTEVKPGLFLFRTLSGLLPPFHLPAFFFFSSPKEQPFSNLFFFFCLFGWFCYFKQPFSSPCSLPFPKAGTWGLTHRVAQGWAAHPTAASLTDVALFLVPHSPVRFPLDQHLWLLQKQMLWTSRGRASWLPLWQPVQELQQLLLRLWWAVLKDRYDAVSCLIPPGTADTWFMPVVRICLINQCSLSSSPHLTLPGRLSSAQNAAHVSLGGAIGIGSSRSSLLGLGYGFQGRKSRLLFILHEK